MCHHAECNIMAFVALPGVVPGSLSCSLGATCQRTLQVGGLVWWTLKQQMRWHPQLLPAEGVAAEELA